MKLIRKLTLCVGLAAVSLLAQDAPPLQPFQAVHLIRVDAKHPDAEKTMLGAISEMNRAITKAGCDSCVYHLWKAFGDQEGKSTYLQISYWPGREVYDKVHNSAEYGAASKNWENLRSVVTEEVYFRFVELKPSR